MKNSKKPILSICIPTWNRWYALKYTLKSIIDQAEFKSGDVEIVISDNASDDETEVEIKKLCNEYKNIRYLRNSQNLGPMPNILKVLSLGEGDYLWLLGSDDFIRKMSLGVIIDKIKFSFPKLILLKQYPHEDVISDNEVLEMKDFNGFQDFSTYVGINYSGFGREVSSDREAFFTFMSIFCINKSYYEFAYNNLIKNFISKEQLDKHSFNFSFVAFSQLYLSDIISIIESPRLVGVSSGAQSSRSSGKKYANDLKLEFDYLKKSYAMSYYAKKSLKMLLHPWIMAGYLAPIKKVIKFCGLMGLYDKLSAKYRKLRGYL